MDDLEFYNNELEFFNLDINARADLVWSTGEFIGFRSYYGYKVSLYVLKGLYVEVWYFPETNQIEKVEVIQDKKDLDHYLKDIDLNKIIGNTFSDDIK